MAVKIPGPFVGMVMAECAQVGVKILSRQAMCSGMSSFIFVLYSNALASLILLHSSLFFHRSERPPLTSRIVFGFFLLGVSGWLALVFRYAGINFSSPTLGTAMLNLVTGFTFVLAVIFRMEKFDWRSSSTSKSMGTIVSIAGAFIITYYKGSPLLRASFPLNSSPQLLFEQSNWIIGGLLYYRRIHWQAL